MSIKYPRTYHLPYSPEKASDDKKHPDDSMFKGKKVVVLEKLDGENATLTKEAYYARSLDTAAHWSRTYIKRLHASIAPLLPETLRLHGENLFATHSIAYTNLPDYFFLFNASNESYFLSWEEILNLCREYYMFHPHILYQGIYDRGLIENAWLSYKQQPLYSKETEGFVVRSQEGFAIEDFKNNVAKFVREGHVQTSEHWLIANQKQNKLRK